MPPTIFDLLKDQDFQNLGVDDKRGVLSHFDPDFAKLGPPDQDKVMQHFNLIRPELTPEEAHPVAKAASDIYTPAFETVGGVAGAGAAAVPGAVTGPGDAAIAAAGGALGIAGGKAAADVLDRATGLKPPIQDASAAATETGKDLYHGTMSELGGRAAGAVLTTGAQVISGPLANKMTDTAKAVWQKAKDMGIDLTPAEVMGSKSLSLFENLLDNAPITGDFMNKFRLRQLQQLVNQRNALVDAHGTAKTIEEVGEQIQGKVDDLFRTEAKLGTDSGNALKDRLLQKMGSNQSYEEVGLAGQEALKRASQSRYEQSNKLYRTVDDYLDPKATMVPNTYRGKALELLDREKSLSPSLQDPELTSILGDISGHNKMSELLQQASQQLGKSPDELAANPAFMAQIQSEAHKPMTWAEMTADRSRLGQLIAENDPSHGFSQGAKGTKLVTDKVAGVYKQLFGSLDQDMGTMVKAAGPQAEEALDLARSFYGESKQIHNQPAILRISRANPSAVVDMVFKREGTDTVKMVRKAIGDDAFEGLKKKFTTKLLDVPEGEELSAGIVQDRLNKYGHNLIEEVYKNDAPALLNLPKQLTALEPDIVKNPFFKSILKKAPQTVVPSLIQKDNTGNAMKIANALGADAKKQISQGFVSMLLKDAAETNHGALSPNLLDSAINKYGDETLKAWLPEGTISDLKDFSKVGMAMQKAAALGNNPSGTGRTLLTGGLGAYTLLHPINALKLVVPASVLAKMYLSPAGRQLLTDGFQTSLSSPEAEKIFGRFSTSAIAVMQNDDDKKP